MSLNQETKVTNVKFVFSFISGWFQSSTGVGPTCTCKALNSSNIQLNCSITYADHTINPINAKMTWTGDGNFYKNDTPARTRPNTKEQISSSVQTVNGYYPLNYQCTVTFAAPPVQYAFVATNAPAFSASCTVPCEFHLNHCKIWNFIQNKNK